jgi:glycosyltransferase involved in cell wall biosynthesis
LLKGIHLAIQAIKQLQKGVVHLTIIGDGAEKQRLEQWVEGLNLKECITFKGFVQRTELPAIFSKHDVLIAPSLYESGGLSVLEGFAHGLPAIVLDCGGHSLSIDPSCGFKIPPTLPKAKVIDGIATAIKTYVEDRSCLKRHQQGAFNKVQSSYAWHMKHDAMLEIYRKAMRQVAPEE